MSRIATTLMFVSLALPGFCNCKAAESPELIKALSFKPRQADVNYEKVKSEETGQCKLDKIARDDGKGFWVTGPAGQPLRWFVDTNGDNKPDRWCYFNNGDEVYRESDSDFNGTADEYRWLNTEGVRWGTDANEDGTIDRWRLISAEEVTSEVVQALASGDAGRFQRLLLDSSEIQSLQLGSEMTASLQKRVEAAGLQFEKWMQEQKLVTAKSRWTNFGADKPGIVPAGTDGSQRDVMVYENAVALFEDDGQSRQLIVGTMIQVDGAWRLASLPRLVGDNSSLEESGVFFNVSYTPRGTTTSNNNEEGISRALDSLVAELQKVDDQLTSATGPKESLHAQRADVLEKLVAYADTPDDKKIWIEQMAETIGAAAQIGEYPEGIARLHALTAKLKEIKADPQHLAYVSYRTITAEHNVQMQQPNAKFDELNDAYLNKLKGFIQEYPESQDSAEAMLQVALAAEFTGNLKDAEHWYGQASKSFASTDAGKKAAGALKRLNLKGKPFNISGPTLDGKTFNSNAYRGGPVIYHCWASWCEGCKADMRALKELQAKYAKAKLKIVGINLDKDRTLADAFLRQNQFPWIHVHDPGGLESTLAVGYGILTLPVNFVVDKDGNVIQSGAHWTDLDRILADLVK